jgi:hypothetical protein
MVNRVTHTLQYADNLCGLTSASSAAACNDWRRSDADSMSARDAFDPTTDAGYLSSRYFPQSQTIDQPLAFVGKSIYGIRRDFPLPGDGIKCQDWVVEFNLKPLLKEKSHDRDYTSWC